MRNKKPNPKVPYKGNSVTEVNIQGKNQSAFAYIRKERLSSMGSSKNAEKMVAWNLGRSTNFSKASPASLYYYVAKPDDLGLRTRVKKFSIASILLGEVIDEEALDVPPFATQAEIEDMLKNGLGLNDTVIEMVKDPEKYEELITEHLENLKNKAAEKVEELTGLDSEDIKEIYEEVLEQYAKKEEAEAKIDEYTQKALDKILKTFAKDDTKECL